MQPRHNQITQQYSSSTDEGCEGCDTDHGGERRLTCMSLNVVGWKGFFGGYLRNN